MQSLFARPTPTRGRIALMLAGSLIFHGGLVGIGALIVPPAPKPEVPWFPDPQYDGPEVIPVPEPSVQPEVESGPTATPEAIEPTVATPPSAPDDPVFAEPSSPTPQQKVATKPNVAVRTRNVSTTPITTAPGNGPSTGAKVGSASGTMSWSMPHPPYPANRLFAGKGTTKVQITTDAGGRIANVVIIQSTGNPVLDAHTVRYVRENWRGPANASRTTEFVYQLR